MSKFKPGEVVADVMAGIGPFAVPAGKKGVFVWANDKNPESYRYLEEAVKRNKVSEVLRTCITRLLTSHRYPNMSNPSTLTVTTLSRNPQTSSSKPPNAATAPSSNHPNNQETQPNLSPNQSASPSLPQSPTLS